MKKSADKATVFNKKSHWERVYSEKNSTEVSWYQQHPERSLELIKATDVDLAAACIDVGGGASSLVDAMLDAGYQNITVLDIAHAAITQAKTRLAGRAKTVTWLEQDITEFSAESVFDLWHDRAVFHFLTDPHERSRYVHAMTRALKPKADAIIACFAPEGPSQCSGLDVVRYSADTLAVVLGDAYRLVETDTEAHQTPNGSIQNFLYCRFKKTL